MKRAYRMQRNSAKTRGIEWKFDFESWLAVWRDSGRIADRGRGVGKYVMARFGDVGAYEPSNVEIILYEKNAADSRSNHPVTASELSARAIGRGRGWTYVKGAYQVSVAKKYIGRFKTEADALLARQAAVDERAASLGVTGK